MAWEVSGGHKDETKADTSLTPWDIANLAAGGDKYMYARWKEYEKVMPGSRSCVVSATLSKKLNLDLSKDKKEGKERVLHEEDEIVGRVEAPTWKRWMRHGLASTFLLRVELDGAHGFDEAVEKTEAESMVIERRWQAAKAERERKETEKQVLAKTDRLLKLAANEVRKHEHATGSRQHILNVVARVARDNPDHPPLDPGLVLVAANCGGPATPQEPDPERDEFLAWLDEIIPQSAAA